MKKFMSVVLSLLFIFALVSCNKTDEKKIVMGFVPHKDGEKLIDDVKPLTDMLSKELGVKVEGFTATNYVAVVEGFGAGQVDFGFIPPFAAVLANKEFQAQPVLIAKNKNGNATYKSQILVAKNSNINNFEDIKGKKVAFVEAGSTSGYLFPAALLKEHGIDLEKDIQYLYAGGHDKALQLLLNGDVDVATTFSDVRERYAKEFPDAMDKTRVLAYTADIPGVSVTISSKLDKEMANKIVTALKKISESPEGSKLLQNLFSMYGFVDATIDDYAVIDKTAEIMGLDLKEQK